MKHNRLATALVVTGSVLGVAACSWFGGDENKQASSQGYSSPSYSSAPSRSTASTSNSGASGSYSSTSPSTSSSSSASNQNYGASSSMSSNIGSSRSSSARSGGSSSEIADVQQHLQQLGYYHGRIDGIWGRQSRQAMAQFQRSQGMQATGQMDQQSIQALNSGSASSSTATGSSGLSNSSSRTGSSNLNSSSTGSSSMGSSNYNSSNTNSTAGSLPKDSKGSPSTTPMNNNGNMDTQTNSTGNTAR